MIGPSSNLMMQQFNPMPTLGVGTTGFNGNPSLAGQFSGSTTSNPMQMIIPQLMTSLIQMMSQLVTNLNFPITNPNAVPFPTNPPAPTPTPTPQWIFENVDNPEDDPNIQAVYAYMLQQPIGSQQALMAGQTLLELAQQYGRAGELFINQISTAEAIRRQEQELQALVQAYPRYPSNSADGQLIRSKINMAQNTIFNLTNQLGLIQKQRALAPYEEGILNSLPEDNPYSLVMKQMYQEISRHNDNPAYQQQLMGQISMLSNILGPEVKIAIQPLFSLQSLYQLELRSGSLLSPTANPSDPSLMVQKGMLDMIKAQLLTKLPPDIASVFDPAMAPAPDSTPQMSQG